MSMRSLCHCAIGVSLVAAPFQPTAKLGRTSTWSTSWDARASGCAPTARIARARASCRCGDSARPRTGYHSLGRWRSMGCSG